MISEQEAIERAMTVRWDTPTQRRIIRDVLDAVFACQTCQGSKVAGHFSYVNHQTGEHLGDEPIPCPECGGTGRDQEWLCMVSHTLLTLRGRSPIGWCFKDWGAKPEEGHAKCGWVSVIRWDETGNVGAKSKFREGNDE